MITTSSIRQGQQQQQQQLPLPTRPRQAINFYSQSIAKRPTYRSTLTWRTRLFETMFQVNRFNKLLLVHLLFYQAVWWSNNSASSHSALNYPSLDIALVHSLIYFNFHDLFISQLLVKDLLGGLVADWLSSSSWWSRNWLTMAKVLAYATLL